MLNLQSVTVTESGVECGEKRYFHISLRTRIGEEVLVAPSAYQRNKLMVCEQTGKFICFADPAPEEVRVQRLGYFPPPPSNNIDLIHKSLIEGHQELIRCAGTSDPEILADYANGGSHVS